MKAGRTRPPAPVVAHPLTRGLSARVSTAPTCVAAHLPPRAVLRRKGTPYDELGLDDPEWDEDRLLELLLRHPVLIERPIVAAPLGVRLCRPSETVLNILPDPQGGAFRKESGEPVIDGLGRRVDRGALD